jgi:hypothetical protein|tara:strand:- start:2483 stop:3265 length:783 start_codon:yes stop_codon:yes gene_type:complete
MATIDLGKIKLVNRGTWSNSTTYTADDIVQYTDGAITSTYICVVSSSQGHTPSTSGTTHASWDFLAKGQEALPSQSGQSGKFLKTDGSSLSFAQAGKTLVKPTLVAHQTSEVSASQSGSPVPSTGTAKFYYPAGAKLSGTFTKLSATSVVGIAIRYSIDNNGTNQHDTYIWCGTGSTLGCVGDNFRWHVGDDGNRQHGNQQHTGATIYITGMSTGTHTLNAAAGTFPDRTHTYFYSPHRTFGDRADEVVQSAMWAWEVEV